MGLRTRFFSLVAVLTNCVCGKWSDGTLYSENPLMVIYFDSGAGWTRDYYVSDLERLVLSRNMPVRNWVLNYGFLTWNPQECRAVPIQSEIDFSKGDPRLYPTVPEWFLPGSNSTTASGSLSAFLSLKEKYPYIKLLPSLGGWSRSHTFHDCLKSRTDVMVQSLVDIVNSFNFDGVDLDWEYPNCDGPQAKCGCHGEPTCQDTPNRAGSGDWDRFVSFADKLRDAFDLLEDKLQKRLYISAALGVDPKIIEGKNELYSVPTPYDWICGSDIFDWVNLMTFKFYGAWEPQTGPMAALYATPSDIAGKDHVQRNIDDSIKRIKSFCSRPEKLIIGLPASGQIWKNVGQGTGNVPGLWVKSSSTKASGWSTWEAGTTPFWSIKKDFETSSDCRKKFDGYSKTATLYCDKNPLLHTEMDIFISYDDARAWGEKMAYARSQGLSGGVIWAASDLGTHSPDYISELFEGAFRGWFHEEEFKALSQPRETVVWEPQSNNLTEFIAPSIPWENFPCPIPFGRNQASMNEVPNACYGPGADVEVYSKREPFRIPVTTSMPDNVGCDQVLIHGSSTSITTTFVSSTTAGSSESLKSTSEAKATTNSLLTSPENSSIKKCQESIGLNLQDKALSIECQELCKYYNGASWCPSTNGNEVDALVNCVTLMAPYCKSL